MTAVAHDSQPPSLVLYDGVCGFCDLTVRWLLARDPEGNSFRFAALQGDTAAELRARHPELPQGIDSMACLETEDGVERLYLRSAAVFRILERLGGPWRWLAALGVLPRGLTDLAYRGFVRIRYRVFGRLDACRVPTTTERARFLP